MRPRFKYVAQTKTRPAKPSVFFVFPFARRPVGSNHISLAWDPLIIRQRPEPSGISLPAPPRKLMILDFPKINNISGFPKILYWVLLCGMWLLPDNIITISCASFCVKVELWINSPFPFLHPFLRPGLPFLPRLFLSSQECQ